MSSEEIPRRNDINRNVPGEMAIRNAMWEVEKMGASEALIEVITMLDDSLTKLADIVDAQ